VGGGRPTTRKPSTNVPRRPKPILPCGTWKILPDLAFGQPHPPTQPSPTRGEGFMFAPFPPEEEWLYMAPTPHEREG
jgi:hypothetical protein